MNTRLGLSNYRIMRDDGTFKTPLVIADVGPWDQFLSVTNDAENVVRELVASGRLPEGRRLLYYDSAGYLDEILIKNGELDGFMFIPKEEQSNYEK